HHITGHTLLPGTAYIDLTLTAAHHTDHTHLEELTLHAPLVVPDDDKGVTVQVEVTGPDESGRREVELYSRTERSWTHHASGVLIAEGETAHDSPPIWPPADAVPVSLEGWYEDLAARGYVYGPTFQGLRGMWRRGAEIFAEVALPEEDHL